MIDVMGPPPAIGKHERHSDENKIMQFIEMIRTHPRYSLINNSHFKVKFRKF